MPSNFSSYILKNIIVRRISAVTADLKPNLPLQRAVAGTVAGKYSYNRVGQVLDREKRRVGGWSLDLHFDTRVDVQASRDSIRRAFDKTDDGPIPPAVVETDGKKQDSEAEDGWVDVD
jgi:hypothetical protein